MSVSGDAAKRKAGKEALRVLMRPIAARLAIGRALAIVCAAISIAPYIALTRIGTILLDAYTSGEPVDRAQLGHETTILLAAFLTQLGLYALALTITHFADLALTRSLRARIVDRIGRAELAWFTDSTSGKIRKAIQDDTHQIHTLVAHAPVETTAAVATPIVLLGYAFYIDWRLGLLAISTLPVYAAVQAWMMRDMGDKTAELDTRMGDISATTVEFAEGIQVVKSFSRLGQMHGRFTKVTNDFGTFYWNWSRPFITSAAVSVALVSVPVLMMVNVGGGYFLIRTGIVTLPQVLTTSLIALVIPLTVQLLGTTAWAYQLAGNSALRLAELTRVAELEHLADAPQREGERGVRFTDVSYSYDSAGQEIAALREVNLFLAPGSITALIGPSGSGKSTLATMLARFRDPDRGQITIDGRDIRSMSSAELYSRVAFVLQDAMIVRMSIRDNIALARPDASEEVIVAAARDAQILADIEALPAGFDTVLGQGTSLSGGQLQRIAIARAIVADTPILILDEATAATDPDCEAEIQRALSRLVAGRTVLVIAHHAETVIGADQICIMARGEITARGSAADISAHPYWQMLMSGGNRVAS